MKVKQKRYKRGLTLRTAVLAVFICALAVGAVILVQGGVMKQKEPSSSSSAKESEPPSSLASIPESSAPESVPSSSESASSLQPEVPADANLNDFPLDFSGSVFIGDSRTQAWQEFGLTKNATFLAHEGLMVNTVFTRPVIGTGENKMTVINALAAGKYQRVYVMLGMNELGWSSVDAFEEKYIEVLQKIKEVQPAAAIYVEAIYPVSAKKSETDKIYNNNRINLYNDIIKRAAQAQGAVFVPVGDELMDGGGALPAGVSTDGVHPDISFCRKWVRHLKEATY